MIVRKDFNQVVANLKSKIGNDFIIGGETAASLLGLTNGYELPLTILSTQELDLNMNSVEVILVKVPVDNRELTTVNGLKVTNIERTLVDLLLHERDPQTTCESLSHYYYSVGKKESWKHFPLIACEYGVYEEFESYIDDAITHDLF